MLRAVLFWPGLILVSAILGTLTLLTAPFDRRGRVIHGYSRLWSVAALRLAGIRTRVHVSAPLAAGRGYVFVANHQSTVDIFVLGSTLPGAFRWVAKRELFRIPVFGPAMRRAGYVPVDRDDPRRARGGLSQAAAVLAAGDSLVVFPEGTRSADGRLAPFKRGAFALAQAAGAPVVPVAISGSRDAIRPGAYRVRSGTVRVEIGRPLASTGLPQAELIARARGAIAAMLAEEPIPAGGRT